MPLLSSNGAAILAPADIQALVIKPLLASAVGTRVSTIVQTGSHATRFPVVVTDPTTGWTAEGAEIAVSDPDLDELVVTPSKLAGLTVVSNELMNDSDPSALDVVGSGLVRDLQTRLDNAYFGNTVPNGPSGLESLPNVQETTVSFDGSLDVFAEGISLAENAGVLAVNPLDGLPNMAFVGNPTDVLSVSTTKVAADSNQPLLGPDATQATGRSILGVPAYSSPAVTQGAMWLVPRDKVFVVLRADPQVIADSSAYFSSDRTGIRCVLRVGFGFPHEQAIVRVGMEGS
ncbi:phage major capsid protein [Mycolicibacterium mageritense]|uniref:phage major capsid protein n=1 Tax=Mycolicibacterium mageritense TaxID=53462 RepID=UPI001E2EA22B|nr:phage major capsid protein [Mycolicibacterium mageritense]MCC9186738.1 phage major capsid protein [Mycolicibacterium mageritense]